MAFRPGGNLMSMRLDDMTAGDIYEDLVFSGFDRWPEPGREVFARGFRREVGGGAAITACGLARLGSVTGVLSVIGQDTGRWVAERLASFNVQTSELRMDPEPTAVTVVLSTAKDRAFLTYPGANRSFGAALASAARNKRINARHVHLGWDPPFDPQILTEVRANDCTVSLDVGWHEDWLANPKAIEFLRHIDIFLPNETEAARMTGFTEAESILRAYDQAGVRRVALKLGPEGAALLWDGEIFRVPAHAVNPVDTTGAGDCFNAGFLHAWLGGKDPLSCLQAANYCGAKSTEGYGGIESFPQALSAPQTLSDARPSGSAPR
jgi:sugar/nucleoside kinase (ribokinase family)